MSRARRLLMAVVPVGVVVATAGTAAVLLRPDHHTEGSATSRPTAQQLLARIKGSTGVRFSGTVVANTSVEVPASEVGAATSAFATVGLLAGSHTAKVWYGGAKRERVAIVDATGEVDYFRIGSDYWRWDPMARSAVGVKLPNLTSQTSWSPIPRVLPGQVGWWAAGTADSHTRLSLDASGHIAGRSVYRLRIWPNQANSLINSVVISADTRTYTPLGVRVYAKEGSAPAMSAAFTRIRFGAPDRENFTFSPPPDASVMPQPSRRMGVPVNPKVEDERPTAPLELGVSFHGSGWGRVLEIRAAQLNSDELAWPSWSSADTQVVSGRWGAGQLFTSPLVTILVTNDSRILVGDVRAMALLNCAGH
jgi:hypothetical protein